MSVRMTVTVSDLVYDRIKNLAYAQQQPLSEVVEHLLAHSLPSNEAEMSDTLDESEKALKREIAAYHLMHARLWEKYPNQHVAIYQGEIVDHDPDGAALSLRIYQRLPDATVLIRQVEAAPEREIRVRSPRFIREGAAI
jgi:predicted transcriptional regulator